MVDKFSDIVQDFLETAIANHNRDGEALPYIFIKIKDSQNVLSIPFNPPTPDRKKTFMQAVGMTLIEKNLTPEWVVFITEGYTKRYKPEESAQLENYKQGQLSTDPDASEIIMVHGQTATGEVILRQYDIKAHKPLNLLKTGESTSTQSIIDYIFSPALENES